MKHVTSYEKLFFPVTFPAILSVEINTYGKLFRRFICYFFINSDKVAIAFISQTLLIVTVEFPSTGCEIDFQWK